MWSTEHTIETTAAANRIWDAWHDVPRWPEWNADLGAAELTGPFVAGSRITMTPREGDPVDLVITDACEPERFVDEARLGETTVRTTHRVEEIDPHRRRVSYRMDVTGPRAETIGPAISGDFPDVLRGLVARAEA